MTTDLDAYLQRRWEQLDDQAKITLNLKRDHVRREFTTALWTKQYYEEQLQLLETQRKGAPMIRLIIEVKGGCVQTVTASEPVEVLIDDHDAADLGPTCFEVDGKYVDEMFTEYENAQDEVDSA